MAGGGGRQPRPTTPTKGVPSVGGEGQAHPAAASQTEQAGAAAPAPASLAARPVQKAFEGQAGAPLADEPRATAISGESGAPAAARDVPVATMPPSLEADLSAPRASEPPLAAPARQSDPLAEAPDAVWYVRPPSGGQYGPATSDVIRTWIAEGRVSSESLVWREGWRDWREAGEVFPELGAGGSAMDVGVIASSRTRFGQRGARAYRRPMAVHTAVIAVLILAAIVLLGVLVWVVNRA